VQDLIKKREMSSGHGDNIFHDMTFLTSGHSAVYTLNKAIKQKGINVILVSKLKTLEALVSAVKGKIVYMNAEITDTLHNCSEDFFNEMTLIP
jgi:hypothetical protein